MMLDMFTVFAIGIVIGASITLLSELIYKMHEADKQWKEKDE